MKRRLTTLALAAALLALLVTPPLAGAGRAHHLVSDLGAGKYGSFAEGMAGDNLGRMYVSVTRWGYADETTAESNVGEVWRVRPDGTRRLVSRLDLTPSGMLMGVAVSRRDRVYVGVFDFASPQGIGSGVFRLEGRTLKKVIALPEGAWPNGLAFHGRFLYITDSALGAVWRVRTDLGLRHPTEPWLSDALLAPGDPATDESLAGIGANGIGFRGRQLSITVSDFGRLVRVRLLADGRHGPVRVVKEASRLKTADGIAVDALGGVWITTNAGKTGASPSGALYRLRPDGVLKTIADDPGWLNYPTTPAFGTTPRTARTLLVENGAYFGFEDKTSPSVWAVWAGVQGQRQR